MVEFAGWEMPVQYDGVIAESKSVRQRAGMFDVSHMGRTWFRGPASLEYLEEITVNDVSKLNDGGSQYSMLCYENGTVVDDIYLYRVNAETFRVVINASNRQKDIEWMLSFNRGRSELNDETFETSMLAVQGPEAVSIIASLGAPELESVERYHSAEAVVAGVRCFAGRTGYTGEDGFELICAADESVALWQALLKAGVHPCGLASRDVLRVEAGLPLYGHEINDQINPIEAGLGWVCSKTKSFLGSNAINAMRESKPRRKIMGIRMASKLVPREGYTVMRNGKKIGIVTSGVFSPTLDCGIAFAMLDAADSAEGECHLIVRDNPQPATIVNKRFLSKKS